MSVTWGRALIGLAVAVCLLGVGVLEVLSERVGAGSLALLQPGDVVRVDPANGQPRLIVVLRHAWQEAESPEK